MMTSSGMPEHVVPEEVAEAGDVDDLGPALGDDLGQAASGREHRQRGDERHDPAVGDEQPVDQPAAPCPTSTAASTISDQW